MDLRMGYLTWISILANLAHSTYLNKANLFLSFSTEKARIVFILRDILIHGIGPLKKLSCVVFLKKKKKLSKSSKTTGEEINAECLQYTDPPFYHKGKILADSKNSALAEGPMQLDHSKLPLCPSSVKGCTHGQLLWDPRQNCLSLLMETDSASQNLTWPSAGAMAVACRSLPLYLPGHKIFFVWLLDGEFSRKELGLAIES